LFCRICNKEIEPGEPVTDDLIFNDEYVHYHCLVITAQNDGNKMLNIILEQTKKMTDEEYNELYKKARDDYKPFFDKVRKIYG